ncbi:hypothetical protein GL297_07110 [Komagataeibacter sp. FXV2]|nr:hypothetical protein [Komagataeibacter sp. FXV2]
MSARSHLRWHRVLNPFLAQGMQGRAAIFFHIVVFSRARRKNYAILKISAIDIFASWQSRNINNANISQMGGGGIDDATSCVALQHVYFIILQFACLLPAFLLGRSLPLRQDQ